MPLITVQDTVQVQVRFVWNAQLVENVFSCRFSSGVFTAGDLLDLANEIEDRVTTDWLPLMATTVTFTEVYAEAWSETLPISATASGANAPGTASGDSMPGNNALCLSLRSAFAGRSRRGRLYTIGMTEGHQTAGVVTTTYRNAWLTAMADLRAALTNLGWEMVIVSLYSNGAPRATPLVTEVQTVISVDTIVDSQRRRLQGRGR